MKMAKHQEMMILPVEKRRTYFREAYALELSKLHATGVCRWPIEELPEKIKIIMENLEKRRVPSGQAFENTKKFFGIKTQKAIFQFLGHLN